VSPYWQSTGAQQGGNFGAGGQEGQSNIGVSSHLVSQTGQSSLRAGELGGSGIQSYYAQPGSTSRTG